MSDERLTILLDMDGPLADFDRHFWLRCLDRGYTFDVEGPPWQRHRYFTEHIPNRRERKEARAMVDAAGWFADLPVTDGALTGVARLLDAGHDLWVCTKPLEANPTCHSDKAAWIAEHFPALTERLIIAPDKSMILGDILFDDAPKLEWFGRADWVPVIFDSPFNRAGSDWADLTHCTWTNFGVVVDTAMSLLAPSSGTDQRKQREDLWRRWMAHKVTYLDPLQRHLLCQATGLHDPRPDGTCRDCEAVVDSAPVCAHRDGDMP